MKIALVYWKTKIKMFVVLENANEKIIEIISIAMKEREQGVQK